MSKGRLVDFDAFWRERQAKQEPIRVKVFGETYELRPQLPAAVMLKVIELMVEAESPEQVIGPKELLELAEGLFGRKTLDKWLAKGLTMEQLDALVELVMQEYGRRNEGKLRELRQQAAKKEQT